MTEQQYFYKVFKLKNGELMAGASTGEINTNTLVSNKFVTLQNPVLFNSYKFMDNEGELVETISMQPLMPISDDSEYQVSTDHIFSVSKMRDTAAQRYVQFLEHLTMMKAEEEKADLEEIAEMQAHLEDNQEDQGDNIVDLSKYSTKILH
jgi:hypothetical protein